MPQEPYLDLPRITGRDLQEVARAKKSTAGGLDGWAWEVPGVQFVSPGYGLDIRQSMGWTKVCGTARSGIWVLKGNARARMLPENLDHLRVRDLLGYARARLSVFIPVWTWSSCQTTN